VRVLYKFAFQLAGVKGDCSTVLVVQRSILLLVIIAEMAHGKSRKETLVDFALKQVGGGE
jgi:hypothetical protein